MLQFFFEMIVAVLAVYGGYTALHELAALIGKWIGAPVYPQDEPSQAARKEDSCRDGGEDSNELSRSNGTRSGDDLGRSGTSSAGRDD